MTTEPLRVLIADDHDIQMPGLNGIEATRRIAQGYKNADIATHLVISPKKVRSHVTNIQ